MTDRYPSTRFLQAIRSSAQRFQRFSPRTLSRLTRAAGALFFLAVFLRLGGLVREDHLLHPWIQRIDDDLLLWVDHVMRSPKWNFLFLDLSSLGSLAVVGMICIVSSTLLILARDPAAVVHLLLVAAGGFQLASWTKHFFDRPRPDVIPKLIHAGGQSFPSGHAVTASAIYLTLAILASRHFPSTGARITFFSLAGLLVTIVAFSRVYLGVHFPTDVLSGALLGGAWALFMGVLFSLPRTSARLPLIPKS